MQTIREIGTLSEREKERFFAMVRTSEDCHEWTGTGPQGYGLICLKRNDGWLSFRAHRVAWKIASGNIPDGHPA